MEMDEETTLEVKTTSEMTGIHPPHKRRHKRLLTSAYFSGEVMMDDKWRKKGKESRGGNLSKEHGHIYDQFLASVATAGAGSRKRTKHREKVRDEHMVVGSAVVPRKLRSAKSKRCGESPSPSTREARFKLGEDPNRTEMVGTKLSEDIGLLSKDEQDVAEILVSLAFMIQGCRSIKHTNNGSVSGCDTGENQSSRDSRPTMPEAEEIPVMNLQIPSTGASSPHLEHLKKELKEDFTSDFNPLNKNVSIGTPKSCKLEQDLNDMPSGSSSLNGVMPSIQEDNSLSPKPSVGLYPLHGTASEMTLDAKHLDDQMISLSFAIQNDASLEMQNSRIPTINNEQNGEHVSVGPSTSCKSTKKSMLFSGDQLGRKKCTTHVYISYFIKKCGILCHDQSTFSVNESSKVVNDPSQSANGMTSSVMNKLEATGDVSQESSSPAVKKSSITPGLHSRKNSMYDFLSLSTGCELGGSVSRMEASGELPIALHSLPCQNTVISSSVSNGYYSSYPNYLSAAAPQQVHFQLPHYLGHPFYYAHRGNLSRDQFQQHQQMCQPHLTHYRASPPLAQRWSGNDQNDASSLIPLSQMQPIISGSCPVEIRGLAGRQSHVPLQPQRMPIPLPATNQSK